MLKSKQELERYIVRCCEKLLNNRDIQRIFQNVKNKYNIPIDITSDIITLRKHPMEFSEFILFCILDILEPQSLSVFYTAGEIELYHKQRYDERKIKFPLIIPNMVQICEDQWIGKFSVKQLMQMKSAQLINYDENCQRTMRHIVEGDKEYYQVAINKTAVTKIKESLKNDSYIPNTLTLNIPVDDGDFIYNDHKLIINNINYFNLTDGYHRYVAMSQIYDLNNEFDYDLELRVTNFDEAKAQHFIYQEDQKTQMKKMDSNSLNQNLPANIVAKRLNIDPLCNIQGYISRNSGIISAGEFCICLSLLFFKNVNKDKEKAEIVRVQKLLREKFNILTETLPEIFETKISSKQLLVILCVFSLQIENESLAEAVKYVLNRQLEIDNVFNNRRIRRKSLNQINAILRDGGFVV